MRPILFIDRDGTIVSETEDEFVDKIEKTHFLDDVLYYLRKIQKEPPKRHSAKDPKIQVSPKDPNVINAKDRK